MSTFPSMTPEYACDKCDKSFGSFQALNGHKMIHAPATPCPECGRDDFASATSLARHRAMEHDVKRSSKSKSTGKPLGRPRKTAVATDWKVEDIFNAVLGILYPNGAVPIGSIPALIVWREDTQRMLEKVMQ